MAIKVLLTLDNSDFKKGITDAQNTAADFVKSLSGVGSGAAPIKDFTVSLQSVAPAANEAKIATSGFTEVIRILNPILREAGVSIQGFAGFSHLAAAGLAGLGVAIGGSVVVALASLEVQAQRTQARIKSLFDTTAQGQAAVGTLSQAAKDLDVQLTDLVDPAKALQDAISTLAEKSKGVKFIFAPGDAGDAKAFAATLETTINLLEATGLTFDQAKLKASQLFDSIKNAGAVTGQALKGLDPATIIQIGQALGITAQKSEDVIKALDKGPATMSQFELAMGRILEQSRKLKEDSGVEDFSNEWTKLLNLIKSEVATPGLAKTIREFLQSTQTDVENLIALWNRLKAATTETQPAALTSPTTPQAFDLPPAEAGEAWARFFAGLPAEAQEANTEVNAALSKPPDFSITGSSFSQMLQGMLSNAQSIWDQIKNIFSQPPPFALQAPQGAAAGGLILGPGTTTSDSILARLSNNEFVMNARATSFYGPSFMAALNAMAVPRDVLPGFSMGGLARAISGAAFAQGGQARTPIHLHIGRQVFGMFADDAVAAALARSSVSEQLSQTGRSPGWRRT